MKRVTNNYFTLLTIFSLLFVLPGCGDSVNVSELFDLGYSKLQRGDYKGAIEDYSKVLKLKNNYALAYYNRGLAHQNLDQKKEAIKDYSQAIRNRKKYPDAYYNRGQAYFDLELLGKAIRDFDKVIHWNPKNAEAYFNRALVKKKTVTLWRCFSRLRRSSTTERQLYRSLQPAGRTAPSAKTFQKSLVGFL